jgi:hypothetical protein
MEKIITLTELRRLNAQVMKGDISSSRMVEIINEKAYKVTCYSVEKAINNFKVEQAKFFIKLHNK